MKSRIKAKAVIFDMDGVIVDSMPYHFLAWYEALRPYGIRVSCFDVYAKEGEKWSISLKDFFKKNGVPFNKKRLSEIFILREKIFKKYFKRFIFENAKEVLYCLKAKGYLLALATSTPDYEARRMLPRNLYRVFDAVVAGNNIKRGKPHPEPYLMAAKKLKIKPSECIVVENAPYGIESAKSAGMYCVAVSTSLPKEFLNKADTVFNNLAEVAEFIAN